jgi:hypothetical protein
MCVYNSTAKDMPAAKVAAGEMEKLNGKQLVAQQKMKELANAAKVIVCYMPKVTIGPIDKEILVITQIRAKITDTSARLPCENLPKRTPPRWMYIMFLLVYCN